MSFASKFVPKGKSAGMAASIIKEKAVVYGLWITQPNGKDAYFIIEVERAKHQTFKAHLDAGDNIDYATFGTILYSGWDEPSAELKAQMREKYGMYEG